MGVVLENSFPHINTLYYYIYTLLHFSTLFRPMLTENVIVHLKSSLTFIHPVLLPPNGKLLSKIDSWADTIPLGKRRHRLLPETLTFSSAYILPGVIYFTLYSPVLSSPSI